MEKRTMGKIICNLRKESGMTQRELAEKMNVTDKAVSKWERDVSCPDINSIPKLADVLGISVDELMNSAPKTERSEAIDKIVDIVLAAVPLAMGVAVIVTTLLKEIDLYSGLMMLGLGLCSLGIYQLKNK